ncbi:protein ARK2N isoform X1 [Rhinolophus sinicus]|uniref:protein ARK2N isoform X1 n=1 Tax=Rhinolophus sinicus TaxID=89399 RepID=UPI003D79BB7D
MKMEEAVGKVEELIESEVPPKTSEQETAKEEDGSVELESQVQKDGVVDSAVLSSMPCLLMELRRDSSESQLASTESDKPTTGRVYESDSSNHCMLSPSSSGHLADSDTLSSAEENEPSQAETAVEGDPSGVSGATVGRKSRRSRSESETSTMAAKKNRQSSDKQNGRVAKVKGHRSQKQKERIRLLRQKREAAARKKYNLLQDSSTSDSDLTCDSSTSSSDDDEEVSGSSKTITAEIPADFSRAGGSEGAPREIPGLLDRGAVCDRNHIGSVLEEAMSCFSQMQRQTEETLCVWMEKLTHLDTGEENNPLLEPRGLKMQLVGQSLSLITQSGAYMQMPDFQELPQQPFDSYVTCWSVDSTLEFPKTCNSFSVNLAENGNISEQPLNLSQNCVNYLLFGLCKKEFVFAHCKFLLIFKNYNSKQFLF